MLDFSRNNTDMWLTDWRYAADDNLQTFMAVNKDFQKLLLMAPNAAAFDLINDDMGVCKALGAERRLFDCWRDILFDNYNG